jgi:hypothetical protein
MQLIVVTQAIRPCSSCLQTEGRVILPIGGLATTRPTPHPAIQQLLQTEGRVILLTEELATSPPPYVFVYLLSVA